MGEGRYVKVKLRGSSFEHAVRGRAFKKLSSSPTVVTYHESPWRSFEKTLRKCLKLVTVVTLRPILTFRKLSRRYPLAELIQNSFSMELHPFRNIT